MEYPFISIISGPLLLEMVALVWVISMGQIELFKHSTLCNQTTDVNVNDKF